MGSMAFRANLGTGVFGAFLLLIGFAGVGPVYGLVGAVMLGVSIYLFITRDEYGVPWWHATLRGISLCTGLLFVFIVAMGVALGMGAGRSRD